MAKESLTRQIHAIYEVPKKDLEKEDFNLLEYVRTHKPKSLQFVASTE